MSLFPAFPIHKDSFIGVATNEPLRKMGVVHVAVDGSVTFTTSVGSKAYNATAGQDFTAEKGSTVTSTAEVWIS